MFFFYITGRRELTMACNTESNGQLPRPQAFLGNKRAVYNLEGRPSGMLLSPSGGFNKSGGRFRTLILRAIRVCTWERHDLTLVDGILR
jgi:hypothetical protein